MHPSATGEPWRANTTAELHELYDRAAAQIAPEEILLQEIIPGDGSEQYSYCAFARNGRPHSTVTARRIRQHPREFGRAATYVETIEAPQIEELSERFLRAIEYHGLIEVEYKRDPRDGKFKLLDVNARAWGFHGIGPACGIDFSYLLFADRIGRSVEPTIGKPGIGWLRLLTDVPTAISDFLHGSLGFRAYIQSLRATRVESVFDRRDPFPFFAELMLLPFMIRKKYPQSMNAKAPVGVNELTS